MTLADDTAASTVRASKQCTHGAACRHTTAPKSHTRHLLRTNNIKQTRRNKL